MPSEEPLEDPDPPRRRRRAVGPVGAVPSGDGGLRALVEPEEPVPDVDRDERLRREVPPHHGD